MVQKTMMDGPVKPQTQTTRKPNDPFYNMNGVIPKPSTNPAAGMFGNYRPQGAVSSPYSTPTSPNMAAAQQSQNRVNWQGLSGLFAPPTNTGVLPTARPSLLPVPQLAPRTVNWNDIAYLFQNPQNQNPIGDLLKPYYQQDRQVIPIPTGRDARSTSREVYRPTDPQQVYEDMMNAIQPFVDQAAAAQAEYVDASRPSRRPADRPGQTGDQTDGLPGGYDYGNYDIPVPWGGGSYGGSDGNGNQFRYGNSLTNWRI